MENTRESESEEDVKVKPAAKKLVKKVDTSSSDDSSSDEETVVPAKIAKPAPKAKAASSSSEESDSEDDVVDPNSTLLCIHDSARPLVSSSDTKKVLIDGWLIGAAVLGVPAKATIKEANINSFVVKTLDRKTLWEMQTPQSLIQEPKSKGPVKKVPAAPIAKNGSVTAKKKEESSHDSDSESEESDEDEPKAKAPVKKAPAAAVAKNGSVAAKKKADSSDDSDSDSEDDSDEENVSTRKLLLLPQAVLPETGLAEAIELSLCVYV